MTFVRNSKHLKNDCIQPGSAEETVTKAKHICTNLNDPDHAIIIRLHNFEKHTPMATRMYYQTWLAGRLRNTMSV